MRETTSEVDEAWNDEAVESGSGDTLGRLPYAQRAADLIRGTHSFDTSVVFGLSGPWGSGKTSLVNMIVEEIQKSDENWAVARFTPWATSDISGLLGEFYSSLASALPKDRAKQVRRALAVTASLAAPAAKLIPTGGNVVAEGINRAGAALEKSPPWDKAFRKAADELKKLGKPILVVVDDIDRLHVDELMALLKVVRLLGRFDGVQYLLAYDDETLYRNMSASNAVSPNDGTAERFMEKIVQYPLIVPPLLRYQKIIRLNAGLRTVFRERVDDAAYERRVSGMLECFTDLLATPRGIDRYIAQLKHHIPLLPPDEVDDEDVQILTLVRVVFPALFNAIPRYRRQLLSGSTGEWDVIGRSVEAKRFELEGLLGLVPLEQQDRARELLIALFPKVNTSRFITNESRRRQSIQHEEYFDRYFAMGILDHDVSDVNVASAVGEAASGNGGPLRELLVGRADEVRARVLSKCTDQANQPISDEGRLQLAGVLAELAGDLPAIVGPEFGDQDQVRIWVANLLVGLHRDTPAGAIRSVVERFLDPATKIRVWRRLGTNIEHTYRSDAPDWFADVSSELARDATNFFLDHVRKGDAAPTQPGLGVAYQAYFALQHDAERLREAVGELVASGEVEVSVVASRLTGTSTSGVAGGRWTISEDFDQETFNQLALSADDPWYDEPAAQVDLTDLSWANRRRFVTGRVRRPPSPEERSPAASEGAVADNEHEDD